MFVKPSLFARNSLPMDSLLGNLRWSVSHWFQIPETRTPPTSKKFGYGLPTYPLECGCLQLSHQVICPRGVVKISLEPESPSSSLRGGRLMIPKPWPSRLGPAEEDIQSIVGWEVWLEVTLQLDGIQWGTSLQDGLAYIPWTLVPFGMIPIGPGSSSSEDHSTIIKITSLTHPLTRPSLTTPPSSNHLSATSRHVIFSLTHDSHDTSQLSHNPNNIHNHLIILPCNGIRPFGKSVSVNGSTESAVLWEATSCSPVFINVRLMNRGTFLNVPADYKQCICSFIRSDIYNCRIPPHTCTHCHGPRKMMDWWGLCWMRLKAEFTDAPAVPCCAPRVPL